MTQLYVKLQTPCIEIKVKAKDSSGAVDALLVGFKRYESKKATKELTILQGLFEDQMGKQDEDIDTTELDIYIKSQVIYIKQANLILLDEEGKQSTLVVPDTRKAKQVADRWESSEDCLDVLLSLYLASAPWRLAFNGSLQKALANANYQDELLKN